MERNLCVSGFGGQGVMTLGMFLSQSVCDCTDKNVTFFPSYGAEQRGGTANCFVVISDELIGVPVSDEVDDLIAMNEASLNKFLPTLKNGGVLFVNTSIIKSDIQRDDIKIIKVEATDMALKIGSPKILNIIMLGVYIGYTAIVAEDIIWQTIENKLGKKPQLLPLNKKAFEDGIAIGHKYKG